jgi:hypothetical protein
MAMVARQSELTLRVMSSVSFSSVTSERLAWSFKMQIQDKGLDKKQLAKYARVFWSLCIKRGDMECPFPEYLVKYYYEKS